MGALQPGWDIRGAATFLDRLTEWERRASRASESIRRAVRLAAGPANGKYREVRQIMSEFLQFSWIFDKDARGVESESNSAGAAPMDVDAVGKREGKGCSADVPTTRRKIASSTKARAKARVKGKEKARLTRTAPPSSKTSASTVAKKATNVQTARSDWQERKTRRSTPSGPMEPRGLRR